MAEATEQNPGSATCLNLARSVSICCVSPLDFLDFSFFLVLVAYFLKKLGQCTLHQLFHKGIAVTRRLERPGRLSAAADPNRQYNAGDERDCQ